MIVRIALTALLALVGQVVAAPALARDIPPVAVTVSGEASPELLADFRQALERMADRRPDINPSSDTGKPAEWVDLQQFWKVDQDVSYTLRQDSERQQLNIVYPFEGEPPYPVIAYFHGGEWQADGRQSAISAPAYWAIYQGYALADVGYRPSGDALWPAQLQDAKAAIRYLRANADQYDLDAEHIVAMGSGSGAHLAQMLAATNGEPASEDPDMGYGEYSSRIQGVVSWSGVSDVTAMAPRGQAAADALMGYPAYESELALEASPVAQIGAGFPPILLVHGANDRVVPFAQSARMAIRVNALTGDPRASVNLLIDAGHDPRDLITPEVMSRTLDFADRILFPDDGNPNRSPFYPQIQTVHHR